MTTDEVCKFVAETFTKVEATRLQPLITMKGWMEQVKAVANFVPAIGGTLSKEIEVIQNYKDSELFRKYTAYILGVKDTSKEERQKFAEEIERKAKDYSGNVIAGMVERLDNINKEHILANLTRARIEGKISIETFFRLSSVLERIPYIDLVNLTSYQTEFYDEDGDTELLYSTGVLRPVQFSEKGDTYILSPLGVQLLEFGLGKKVAVEQVKGTSIGLIWG